MLKVRKIELNLFEARFYDEQQEWKESSSSSSLSVGDFDSKTTISDYTHAWLKSLYPATAYAYFSPLYSFLSDYSAQEGKISADQDLTQRYELDTDTIKTLKERHLYSLMGGLSNLISCISDYADFYFNSAVFNEYVRKKSEGDLSALEAKRLALEFIKIYLQKANIKNEPIKFPSETDLGESEELNDIGESVTITRGEGYLDEPLYRFLIAQSASRQKLKRILMPRDPRGNDDFMLRVAACMYENESIEVLIEAFFLVTSGQDQFRLGLQDLILALSRENSATITNAIYDLPANIIKAFTKDFATNGFVEVDEEGNILKKITFNLTDSPRLEERIQIVNYFYNYLFEKGLSRNQIFFIIATFHQQGYSDYEMTGLFLNKGMQVPPQSFPFEVVLKQSQEQKEKPSVIAIRKKSEYKISNIVEEGKDPGRLIGTSLVEYKIGPTPPNETGIPAIKGVAFLPGCFPLEGFDENMIFTYEAVGKTDEGEMYIPENLPGLKAYKGTRLEEIPPFQSVDMEIIQPEEQGEESWGESWSDKFLNYLKGNRWFFVLGVLLGMGLVISAIYTGGLPIVAALLTYEILPITIPVFLVITTILVPLSKSLLMNLLFNVIIPGIEWLYRAGLKFFRNDQARNESTHTAVVQYETVSVDLKDETLDKELRQLLEHMETMKIARTVSLRNIPHIHISYNTRLGNCVVGETPVRPNFPDSEDLLVQPTPLQPPFPGLNPELNPELNLESNSLSISTIPGYTQECTTGSPFGNDDNLKLQPQPPIGEGMTPFVALSPNSRSLSEGSEFSESGFSESGEPTAETSDSKLLQPGEPTTDETPDSKLSQHSHSEPLRSLMKPDMPTMLSAAYAAICDQVQKDSGTKIAVVEKIGLPELKQLIELSLVTTQTLKVVFEKPAPPLTQVWLKNIFTLMKLDKTRVLAAEPIAARRTSQPVVNLDPTMPTYGTPELRPHTPESPPPNSNTSTACSPQSPISSPGNCSARPSSLIMSSGN